MTPNRLADTMTALRAHRRGGPEVLIVESAPVPRPAAGEVLVAVHAAAITFDELTWDETWRHLPAVPSHEVSGVVAALADDVTDFAVGDEVYALVRFDRDGAAAEYVTVPAADLATRPTTVPHAVAAALPLAGLTAWQALVEHAKVRAGERVLVLGGTGGVGALTVQVAHLLGAEVTASIRSDAAELMRELGADHVVDARTAGFAPQCYDVVIDTVGGQALDGAFAAVRRGGRLVTLSAPPPAGKADELGVEATFFIVTPDRGQLAELSRLVDAGELRVEIADTFPLARGRDAYQSRGNTHRRPGKTVLLVRE